MSTTKYRIAEQVMEIIKGGDYSVSSSVDIRSVMELVGQVTNTELKAEYYGPHIGSGEVNPNGLIKAVYPAIKVVRDGNFSRIQLPTMPIKMPMNMGCYEITKEGDLLGQYQFIPVPSGMWALLSGFSITSDVLRQICYVNEGLDVIFNKEIISLYDIKNVRVKLVVADTRNMSEHEPLPIPADMESKVVTIVANFFKAQGPGDPVVDSSAEPVLDGMGRK